MTIEAGSSAPLEALTRYRLAMIRQVTALCNDDGTLRTDAASSAKQVLLSLLAASLKELQVAEEELRASSAALLAERSSGHERTRHYRELFAQSPAPTLVTDVFGTVCEANFAAGRLFRRAPEFLVRKPIAALVPATRRDEFRRQFSHLSPEDGPRDWHFTICRQGDVPLNVCATVSLVSGLGPTSSGVLCWLFGSNAIAAAAR
jgi:PAS domain S-box-containing protein